MKITHKHTNWSLLFQYSLLVFQFHKIRLSIQKEEKRECKIIPVSPVNNVYGSLQFTATIYC